MKTQNQPTPKMFRFVVYASAVAAALGQTLDERDAKIIKEQRFNNGDGRTGSAFATENKISFHEESDENGNRIGQYSFIGDDGKEYITKYIAGPEGFRIIEGDHVPSTGIDAAAFVSEAGDGVAPVADVPVAAPQPSAPIAAPIRPAPVRAAPTPAARVVETAPATDYYYEETDPDFNPFINPHDPTHRNFAFNKAAAKFAPKVPGVLGAHDVPPCAGCEGLNPFINPFDASHQAGQLAGHQAGFGAGIPNARPVAQAAPALRARPTAAARPVAQQLPLELFETTTAAPRRFFPPGKIALNRFETGFNFDFSS